MSGENTLVRYRRPPGGHVPSDADLEFHRNLTDEQIEAAALSDPDCPPLKEEQLSRMKRIPVAKSARWRSGMTQSAFAEAFGFTLGRLRDLEQGRTQPDPATESYLRLIQLDAEAVLEMLSSAPTHTPDRAA